MSKRPLEDDPNATVDQEQPATESHKRARTGQEDAREASSGTTGRTESPNTTTTSAAGSSTASTSTQQLPPPSASSSSSRPMPAMQQQPQQQQQQQQQHRSARRPGSDHAFFGSTVPDDVVRVVSEFLFEHCNRPNVEIEAKLGVLIDNRTGQRIQLPVRNEVAVVPAHPSWYRFSSDMTLEQHAHFNRLLNRRFEEIRQNPATQYKHTRETDRFFKDAAQGKVRVSVDQKTNKVIPNGIVKKDRVADLDIYSPRNSFDFRISVNIEAPAQMPTGTPQFERSKDRISYRHNHFKIDLTQVKRMDSQAGGPRPGMYQMQRPMGPNGGGMPPDMTHELEIEFVHPEELIREREAWVSSGGQQRERFMDMVGWFVDNIRGLAAKGALAHPIPVQRR